MQKNTFDKIHHPFRKKNLSTIRYRKNDPRCRKGHTWHICSKHNAQKEKAENISSDTSTGNDARSQHCYSIQCWKSKPEQLGKSKMQKASKLERMKLHFLCFQKTELHINLDISQTYKSRTHFYWTLLKPVHEFSEVTGYIVTSDKNISSTATYWQWTT